MCSENVWIMYVKLKVLENCLVPDDDSLFMNGTFFVPAENIDKALSALKAKLSTEKFEILDISRCQRHNLDEWNDNSEASRNINRCAEKARLKKGIYGIYEGYE